jgi:hypothetical protein
MAMKHVPNPFRSPGRSRVPSSRLRLRSFLADSGILEADRLGRWKRRWTMASAAAFATVAALSLGDISWRTAVMVVAASAMLAMSGDMLDRAQE